MAGVGEDAEAGYAKGVGEGEAVAGAAYGEVAGGEEFGDLAEAHGACTVMHALGVEAVTDGLVEGVVFHEAEEFAFCEWKLAGDACKEVAPSVCRP